MLISAIPSNINVFIAPILSIPYPIGNAPSGIEAKFNMKNPIILARYLLSVYSIVSTLLKAILICSNAPKKTITTKPIEYSGANPNVKVQKPSPKAENRKTENLNAPFLKVEINRVPITAPTPARA